MSRMRWSLVARAAAVPVLATAMALVAVVQALAVYESDVPSYFPRGPEHPSWNGGSREAARLLGVNERIAPTVRWVEQAPAPGGGCEQGDAYWVIASAKGEPADLLRARDRIAQVWRVRYGNVGGEVEDATTRLADAQSPLARTVYHLAVGVRGDRIVLQVGVPGCFGPARRPISN